MIKLFFLFISLLASINVISQNKRFFYKYEYRPDTTDLNLKKKEIMFLDILNDKSEFFSHKKFASDSIMDEARKLNKFAMPLKDIDVSYKIIKSQNGIHYENNELELGKISVNDTRKIIWTILMRKKLSKIMLYRGPKHILQEENGLHGLLTIYQLMMGPTSFMVFQG